MARTSTSPKNGALTGRARGRIGFFGRVVMQVEKYQPIAKFRYPNPPRMLGRDYHPDELETHWVDATTDDLTNSSFALELG